jgi:poly(A)-specific ribonuclease
MLRLSTKIDVDIQQKLAVVSTETDTDVSFKDALEEQGGVSLVDFPKNDTEPVILPPVEDPSLGIADVAVLNAEPAPSLNGKKKKKNKNKKKKKGPNDKSADPKFVSNNLFENLREMSLKSKVDAEGEDWPIEEQNDVQPNGEGSWADEPYIQDKTGWVAIEKMKRKPMELMPAFDSEFWQEFGNKLRIFGTEELSLKIAEWPKKT